MSSKHCELNLSHFIIITFHLSLYFIFYNFIMLILELQFFYLLLNTRNSDIYLYISPKHILNPSQYESEMVP